MSSHSTGAHGRPSAARRQDQPADDRYEYRHLTLPRGTTRADARAVLAEHAEYGRWELATLTLYRGGARTVRLRRRILRVQRTL